MLSDFHEIEELAKKLGTGQPHFVLYREKKPMYKNWQKTPETATRASAHKAAGGQVGLIPASVGLAVVDVDEGDRAAVSAVEGLLGDSLVTLPSGTPGRFHVYYRSESKRTNVYQWAIPEVGSGEVLLGTRAAILYHPEMLAGALADYPNAPCVDLEALPKTPRGKVQGRNDQLFKDALKETKAADRARAAGLTDDEIGPTVASAVKIARTPPESDMSDDPAPGPGVFFDTDHTGLARALDWQGLEIRHDERTKAVEIRLKNWTDSRGWYERFHISAGADGWVLLDSKLAARLRTHTADTLKNLRGGKLNFTGDAWKLAILSLTATKGVDAVKDWMDSLPKWDGVERLSSMFTDALGVENTPLNRAMSRILLLAAVRRTYEPAVKHELIPLLVGAQGSGKSTFCQHLLPVNRRTGQGSWFSDSVDLSETAQKQVEATGSSLIVEFSDVSGIQRAKLDRLKAYITRQQDRYRPPWHATAAVIERRWVGIGTSNDDGTSVLPPDPTGNRRWVAMTVDSQGPDYVRRFLDSGRDQLWAEAIAAHRAGEQHWLTADLEREQASVNKSFTSGNEVVGVSVEKLTGTYAGREPVALSTLMVAAGIVETQEQAAKDVRSQKEFARELRAHAWRKKRQKGGGVVWVPPVWTCPIHTTRLDSHGACQTCETPEYVCFDGCGTKVHRLNERCQGCIEVKWNGMIEGRGDGGGGLLYQGRTPRDWGEAHAAVEGVEVQAYHYAKEYHAGQPAQFYGKAGHCLHGEECPECLEIRARKDRQMEEGQQIMLLGGRNE